MHGSLAPGANGVLGQVPVIGVEPVVFGLVTASLTETSDSVVVPVLVTVYT